MLETHLCLLTHDLCISHWHFGSIQGMCVWPLVLGQPAYLSPFSLIPFGKAASGAVMVQSDAAPQLAPGARPAFLLT